MKIGKLMIIPQADRLSEYIELAKEYGCGFEYNDFFLPNILDDAHELDKRMALYNRSENKPLCSTVHGAFFDITIFSDDPLIQKASELRVRQSLDIAKNLGATGVIFHTNYIPNFKLKSYRENWIKSNAAFWKRMLEEYPMLNIYIENMFDTDPELLAGLGAEMKNCGNFGICLDYAHAHVFGEPGDIDKWINTLAPYVKHLHINDNDYSEDLHLAVGDGKINWRIFGQYYEKYFSNVSVLVEVTGIEKVRKSLEFLSRL